MAASRQFWLASLGAAVVTRDWAQDEAASVFRTLVKEGTAVEARTIRVVGNRLEVSVAKANVVWKQARRSVEATVREVAGTAVALVQANLPTSLPKVTLPAMLKTAPARARKTPAKRTIGQTATKVRASGKRAVKTVKRAAKAATKK